MKRGLFLDRDGTLIVDKNYLGDPAGVELIPGTAEALRLARELGLLLFLFTNQSGIGRGYFTREAVDRVHARMEALLGLEPPLFTAICVAPERPDEPGVYRKPSPRFILEMIARHDLDPRASYMVGDSGADILAAINAGIQPVAVATGKEPPAALLPEAAARHIPVFPNLLAFVQELQKTGGKITGRDGPPSSPGS